MYYCYLRAKQYELLAVRSCLTKIVQKIWLLLLNQLERVIGIYTVV